MSTATARFLAAVALLVGLVAAMVPSSAVAACSAPIVDVGSVSQAEGTGSTTTFRFPVSITAQQGCPADGSVKYHTRDGSRADKDPAVAGEDYQATSGELRWSGQSAPTQFISVKVNGDKVPERLEVFWLVLDSPKGVQISHSAAAGWIRNDDTGFVKPRAAAGDECPGGPHCAGTTLDSGICWTIDKSVYADFVFSSAEGERSVVVNTVEDGPNPGYVPVRDELITAPPGEYRATVRIRLTQVVPMEIKLAFDKLPEGYTPGNLESTITVVPSR
jgi:hypothetical protein